MTERLVDFVVERFIGRRVSGWNTKLGAASTALLSVSAAILVVVQSIGMVQHGLYVEAVGNLGSPEMLAALGGLGFTKAILGNRLAIDKLTTGELHRDLGVPPFVDRGIPGEPHEPAAPPPYKPAPPPVSPVV